MTSPKQLRYSRKNVKIIIWILFAIFIAFKNMHVFKMFIFDFKNVHPTLDFLTRQGKFISYFSDFYSFFYAIFFAELKKKDARADWAKGPADGPPPRPLLLPHAAGVRPRHGSSPPPRCPLPQASSPPLHIYPPLRFRHHRRRRSRRRRRI